MNMKEMPAQLWLHAQKCRSDPVGFIAILLRQRWIRFGLVGLAATVAYFILGILFVHGLKLPVIAGNALAYILGFVVSYLGQSMWTFRARGSHRQMLPRFAITQAIGLVINSALVELLMRIGASYEIAMLAAIVLVPVVVYVICKFWVFPDRSQQGE